jgi:hypothetical protein
MKKLIALLILLAASAGLAADVKISQLPLGVGATVGVNDSFPYVQASTNVTKRLTLWDLIHVPAISSTYAPKASPTFTGTVTAPTFVGALTGNASTASALAANPTDCGADTFANAIAANGNLTCSTVGVPAGGTGLASGTAGGVLAFTASTTLASSLAGSSGQILRSAGTSVPTWSTATYPASTTANQLLYSSASNTIAGLASANTGVLVTNSSGVPSIQACTTANRVLRTDGSALTCSQVAASTDLSGQVPIGSGGTGQATKAAAYDALSPLSALGDIVYGGASGTGTRLAGNTTSTVNFLKQTGTGVVSAAPVWGTIDATDIPNVSAASITSGTLAKARGGTAQDNSSLTFPSTGSIPVTTSVNLRIAYALVTFSGGTTPTLTAQSGDFSGVTDNGTGDTSVTFTGSPWSAVPICTTSAVNINNNTSAIQATSPNTVNVRVRTYNTSNATVDVDFNLICVGAR